MLRIERRSKEKSPFTGRQAFDRLGHEIARKCPSIDRVVISTEDEEIAEVARSYGAEVPFLRPKRTGAG